MVEDDLLFSSGTEFLGEALDQLAQQAPARRVASPSEIAEAAVYLASAECLW